MKQKRFDSKLITSIIGEGSYLKGEIETQYSIRIEGHLEGNIHAQGDVFLDVNCHVKGNITARSVSIFGELIGNVSALQGVLIGNTGKVYGDIKGDRLNIDEGGLYKGSVQMDVLSNLSDSHIKSFS